MDQGMGVAFQLRATGQRLAQLTMSDLCRGWRLEFAIHAGATVEYLAKALVAKNDVRSLFTRPDGLTEGELTILLPPDTRATFSPPDQQDREAARKLVAERHTITAKSALERAGGLLRRDGQGLDVAAARSVLDIRNRALHLTDLSPATDFLTAQHAIKVAESLWSGLPADLWGHFSLSADLAMQEERDELHWNTVNRIALAHDRHSLQGIVSNHQRARLADLATSTGCPACRSPAHQEKRRGPGPDDTAAWADTVLIEVLTCLSCGLELFGTAQIDHARSLRII